MPKSPRHATQSESKLARTGKKRRERSPLFVLLNGLVSLAFIAALAGGALFYWGATQFAAPGPLQEEKAVLIPSGAGVRVIADQLQREGVIDNSMLFVAGTVANQARYDLKAGEYAFPANASMARVLETIVAGRSIQHAVTVPEGLTTQQIIERVRAHPVLLGEIEEIPEEGSLLPDTYTFTRGMTRIQVVERMKSAQQRALEEIWASRAPDLPIETPEELVTLASIVEKETGRADERPRVAAVFVNRLNQSMRLQSDPTIIYGLVGGQGSLGRGIRRSEIEQATPYNTYVIDGLPPTPIANPGRAAMEAVANPIETDDLYFVADGTGGHAFAVTYDEHRQNVGRWREIERERREAAATAADQAPAEGEEGPVDAISPEDAEEVAED